MRNIFKKKSHTFTPEELKAMGISVIEPEMVDINKIMLSEKEVYKYEVQDGKLQKIKVTSQMIISSLKKR